MSQVLIDSDKLREIIEEVVFKEMERTVRQHLQAIIITAKDEATKAIALKLLQLAIEDSMKSQS